MLEGMTEIRLSSLHGKLGNGTFWAGASKPPKSLGTQPWHQNQSGKQSGVSFALARYPPPPKSRVVDPIR